jgi:hypothetical protein
MQIAFQKNFFTVTVKFSAAVKMSKTDDLRKQCDIRMKKKCLENIWEKKNFKTVDLTEIFQILSFDQCQISC